MKRIFVLVSVLCNVASASYIVINWDRLHRPAKGVPVSEVIKSQNEKSPVERYRIGTVKGAIAEKGELIEECYDSYLRTEPHATEGVVTVNWLINTDGEVANFQLIKSDMQDENFVSCVTEHIKSMRFSPPPQKDPYLVGHKFSFKRKSPKSIVFQ